MPRIPFQPSIKRLFEYLQQKIRHGWSTRRCLVTKRFWKRLFIVALSGSTLLSILLIGIVYSLITPVILMAWGTNQIYKNGSVVPNQTIGIVFGAGVKSDGTPSDVLKDRLITAAELYEAGSIQTILVSGDNRFEYYNEPEAMAHYLIEHESIPESAIVLDYAGRRTYDTCARASTIFQVEQAILITQGYHLPRAIFHCQAMGIDSTGYSATRQDYVELDYYKFREWIALNIAPLDVYLRKPDYIGGPTIPIQ